MLLGFCFCYLRFPFLLSLQMVLMALSPVLQLNSKLRVWHIAAL